MKRRILFWLTVLVLAIMLSGCGNPVKTEEALLEDLSRNSDFSMVEGSQITEFSIVKRLTDKDSKTDSVYVSLLIDHPNATASRAYVMNYTLYNDGWHLDNIERYDGDEVDWTVTPKNPPSNEQIMDAVIAYSNAQIDAAYENQLIPSELRHIYFFEEGKYATSISPWSPFSGEQVVVYDVTTNRVFNYATVCEEQLVAFEFYSSTFSWELNTIEINYTSGTWHLSGLWGASNRTEDFYLSLLVDNTSSENNPYTLFECGVVSDGDYIYDDTNVYFPTSQKITSGYVQLGDIMWSPVYMQVFISADMIICIDKFSGTQFTLEPLALDSYPAALDSTGILD